MLLFTLTCLVSSMLSSNLLKGYRTKACLSTLDHDVAQQSIKRIFKEFAPSPVLAPLSSREDVVLQPVQELLFKLLSRHPRKAQQSKSMSTCPKCSTRLIQPPTLSALRIRFPALTVDSTLDRSQPRCQQCDEMLARRLATEAELAPPAYINHISKVERVIKKLRDLIDEDIEDEEDASNSNSIVRDMQRKWVHMVQERDANLKGAWNGYWAVWGVTRGQDIYSKDETD